MSVPNPFPLNIGPKEDSWEKLQLLANVAEQFKVDAAEFNKMVQALEYLYTTGGGSFQSLPPLQFPYYANVADMYANQANQTLGFMQKVLDGPGDLLVTYYLYNGGTTASAADYDQLNEAQAQILEASSTFFSKTIKAVHASFEGEFELPFGYIVATQENSVITSIIFDESYSNILAKAIARKAAGEPVYFDYANITKEKHIRGEFTGFSTYEATDRVVATISTAAAYAIPSSDMARNDTLHLFLPRIGGGSASGEVDLTPYQLISQKGAADGYASLDGSGKVPSGQLPSYVDDVLEFANLVAFPGTGETGKIYVALDTNFSYRWTGSVYVKMIDLTAAEAKTLYESNANTNEFNDTEKAKLGNLRPRTPIVATGVSGTYNIDFALSIEWKITCVGATTITFSNYDKALGETTGVYITGAVPVLPATVNVVPGSEDFDASLRNYMVLNVFDATVSSEIVDMQNKLMTV